MSVWLFENDYNNYSHDLSLSAAKIMVKDSGS